MENHNEDFFARTDIAALRAMRRQYPGLRRLLRRDDTLKDADLLTVYGVLLATDSRLTEPLEDLSGGFNEWPISAADL